MHKMLLGMALLTTLVVAGLTVHLHIRAHLRAYELARGQAELTRLTEERDARRLRVASLWAPERVHRLAELLRRARAERAAYARGEKASL